LTPSRSNSPRAKRGASVRDGEDRVCSQRNVGCEGERQAVGEMRSEKNICLSCRAKVLAISALTELGGTLDLWSATATAIKAPIRLFGVQLFDAEQKLWHHAFLKLGLDQSVLRACAGKFTQ